MTAPIDIAGPGVRARVSRHESGRPMICFFPYRPDDPSAAAVEGAIAKARALLGSYDIVRICLDADQGDVQAIVQGLGFALDGIEYELSPGELIAAIGAERLRLPAGLTVRPMSYDEDIDAVASLERTIHAADATSRVSFDTDEAVAGMRDYYRQSCGGSGAFVLLDAAGAVRGVVGFMPDRDRPGSVHVSSVGLALELQGRGLFFPLLFTALAASRFAAATSLTGSTTTERLVEAARRHPVRTLGSSWTRLP